MEIDSCSEDSLEHEQLNTYFQKHYDNKFISTKYSEQQEQLRRDSKLSKVSTGRVKKKSSRRRKRGKNSGNKKYGISAWTRVSESKDGLRVPEILKTGNSDLNSLDHI
jgi:hypothetical protein